MALDQNQVQPAAEPVQVEPVTGMNLSRRATLTSLASAMDYVAGISVQLIINPLLVHGLGPILYGAWRVLYSVNGYLWAASGRSAQALTWVLAKGQHSLTEDEKRERIASAILVWLLFLPLLLLVGGLGAWYAPQLLNIAEGSSQAVRLAAGLLTLDAIVLALLSIPRSALQGENLGYKRMGLSAMLVVISGMLMAAAVTLHTGIIGVAVANAAGTTLTGLLFWRVSARYVPWLGVRRPSRATLRWFLGLSGWFTAWKFVFELMAAGDVIVLGVFGSVLLVTVYTLTKFVAQALIPLIGIVFEGSSPGLGGVIGRGETSKAVRVRSEIMALTWVISTTLGASLLAWNGSFVALWVGERFYAGAWPSLLIVLMTMQFAFTNNDARIIDLTLQVRAKVVAGAISAVVSIVLAALLMSIWHQHQIEAMCVGMLLGRLILTVMYPLQISKTFDLPFSTQLRGVPRPAVVTVMLFALAIVMSQHLRAHSWIALVAGGGATAAAMGLAALGIGLSGSQRRALWKRGGLALRRSGRGPLSPGGGT